MADVTRLREVIAAFMKRKRLTMGDGFFATPVEWEARGERADGAVLIAVYDGAPCLRRMLSLDGEAYALHEEVRRLVEQQGFFFEEATCWFGGFYPLPAGRRA